MTGRTPSPPPRPARPSPSTLVGRSVSPVVLALRRLPALVWAAVLVGVVVLAVLVLAVANPGERVGPVRPAAPPVGGPDLPSG